MYSSNTIEGSNPSLTAKTLEKKLVNYFEDSSEIGLPVKEIIRKKYIKINDILFFIYPYILFILRFCQNCNKYFHFNYNIIINLNISRG